MCRTTRHHPGFATTAVPARPVVAAGRNRRYFDDLRAERRTANYFGTPNGYFSRRPPA
jgi:hypothetical protein